jgi:hypothetical protein
VWSHNITLLSIKKWWGPKILGPHQLKKWWGPDPTVHGPPVNCAYGAAVVRPKHKVDRKPRI